MLLLLQEALVGAYRKMGLENLWLPDLRYVMQLLRLSASHEKDPGQTELGDRQRLIAPIQESSCWT